MLGRAKKKRDEAWHVPLSGHHADLIKSYRETFGVDFTDAWYGTLVQAAIEHMPTRHGEWTAPVVDPWDIK